ncbi:histone H1-like [Antennarius striatus]|uniref:histone H1-like n=1 Tax=Antennarius striatus TaxID=241820 RepID=UPI0035AFD351
MTDEVAPAAPAAQAKTNPKKKKPTATKKPGGPPMSKLIKDVVGSCKDRRGMSMQSVKKALADKGVDTDKNNKRINVVLTRMVTNEALVQVKGLGASGSYKLPKGEPAKKEKKEDKKKKPTAKKPVAKKPAAKKSPKKPAAKKSAAKPKKASAKKPAVKKPAAKKVASRSTAAKSLAKKPSAKVAKKSSPVKKSADRKTSRAKGTKSAKQAKGSKAKK